MADKKQIKCKPIVVMDDTEEWASKDGQYSGVNVKVVLDTGQTAFVSTKEKYVQSHKDALGKLIGKEVEVEVEDRGQYGLKITDYPGRPGGGGAGWKGGGGGGTSNEQIALLAAAYSGLAPEKVIELAEGSYLPWLKKATGVATSDRGAAQSSPRPSQEPVIDKAANGTVPVPTASLTQVRALRRVIEGLGWSEEDACAKAGVSYLGEIPASDVGKLVSAWSNDG